MRCLLAACLSALLVTAPRAQSPDWPLPAVLARAATYLDRYAEQMTGVVVEESYVQDVFVVNRFGYRIAVPKGPSHRTLKSDLLLVRPVGSDNWLQFRDVFEVDGRPVRDRNDRLVKLFLEPSKSTQAQTDKIVKESARYNIGEVERTINLPVLAMTFLARRTQPGFEFNFGGFASPPELPKQPVFIPPPDTTVIGFTETQVRSFITSPQGKNLKSRGRFWISLPTGRVMMSELVVDDFTLRATIHVAYAVRPGLDVPVPVEMHEVYFNQVNNSRVQGHATYAKNFRRFDVRTDEAIGEPQPR